jgi:hypothetical protein
MYHMPSGHQFRPALVFVIAACLAACAQPPRPTITGRHPGDWNSLVGRTLVSVSAVTGGQPADLVPGTTLTLKFSWGRQGGFPEIMANGGCNSFAWPSTLITPFPTPPIDSSGRLTVMMGSSTLVGCNPKILSQDDWFQEFLESSPIIEVDGSTVSLSNGVTTITMVDEA